MIAAQRQVRVLVSPLLLRTSHALRRLPHWRLGHISKQGNAIPPRMGTASKNEKGLYDWSTFCVG